MSSIDIGEIDFRTQTPIVKIVAGQSHVAVLDADGYVWAWGQNDKGQLGLNFAGYKENQARSTPNKI